MSIPKIVQGGIFVADRKQAGGKRNLGTLQEAQSEQAKCHACGCDDCKGYETVTIASTGELAVRYYTGPTGGPYTEVVEPYAVGIAAVNALYAARSLTPTPTPSPSPSPTPTPTP